MEIEKAFEQFSQNVLTPEFLERVEKWARYDGKKISVGDLDVSVENMGTFKIVTTSPKLIIGKGTISTSKTETEDHVQIFDVTKITNHCVCSDYNTRILIAERHPDWADEDYRMSRPAKLFVYCIFPKGNDDKAQYPKKPSFKMLKTHFEGKVFQHYNSLLREFCDDYKLIPFNDATDRIFNFSGIAGDLEMLECEEESKKASEHIKVPKRLTRKEREEAHERHMEKLRGRRK